MGALPVFPGEKVQANFSHFVLEFQSITFSDLAFSLNKTLTKYQTGFSAVPQTKKCPIKNHIDCHHAKFKHLQQPGMHIK